MPEQIRNILNRIVEWWKKFTTRQKAVIISTIAVVVVALIILGVVVSRPTWVTIITCEDATEASQVKSLLDDNSIAYQVSSDGMTFQVHQEDEANANILLGSNDIQTDDYTIDKVVDGSFSTTEADKQKKYQVYLETKFKTDLETIKQVDSAEVNLSIPNDDGTIIANDQDSYANVILTLNDDLDTDQAASIAKYLATGLGNDDTKNITIIDSDGNTLFSGGDESTAAGQASTNQSAKQKAEDAVKTKVENLLASDGANGTSLFDNVSIGVNLSMNFDATTTQDYRYYVEDGNTQGYLDSKTTKSSETVNGTSGTPGTDSNDDTTYVLQDNENSTSTTDEETDDYLPNETITSTTGEVGAVDYDESSISIVAYNTVVYDEDQLKADGKLDDMTFDEFVAQNSDQTAQNVDQTVYDAVSQATGIPTDNISIIAYNVPMFNYSDSGRDWTDYLQIILAVAIFVMLGIVVFRTLRREEEEETEEEVSVEDLLQNQEEENLEDIGFSEKSEQRVLIEKFVDENPEAVASLLRNWLNDDWS